MGRLTISRQAYSSVSFDLAAASSPFLICRDRRDLTDLEAASGRGRKPCDCRTSSTRLHRLLEGGSLSVVLTTVSCNAIRFLKSRQMIFLQSTLPHVMMHIPLTLFQSHRFAQLHCSNRMTLPASQAPLFCQCRIGLSLIRPNPASKVVRSAIHAQRHHHVARRNVNGS